MSRDCILNFHLASAKRQQVAAGQGIYGLIAKAVSAAGWRINLRDEADPVGGAGYHLIYNRAVTEPHSLVLRRCYMNPFWRIEATNDRWDWPVADKAFPGGAGQDWFLKRWRARIFGDMPTRSRGYIFMPLQGKLAERRHFQAQSPIQMIASTLAADPTRRVIATLHPREEYTAADRDGLRGFGDRFALSDRPSLQVLAGCDYVVTQNSGMALTGFFAHKPAVLFARIDFNHIAGSVPRQGVGPAFRAAQTSPPFAAYLHWFFKENAISAIDENATAQIQACLRRHGWPI